MTTENTPLKSVVQDAADCLESIANSLCFMARGVRQNDLGAYYLLLSLSNEASHLEDRLREALETEEAP
jgi:hypothetical protein